MTNPDYREREEMLDAFFTEQLAPAAERLREQGIAPFPLGPEPEAETWYVVPVPDQPEFITVERDTLEETLRTAWEGTLPELAALAAPLVDLAQRLGLDREDPAELSPYLYKMF